MTGREAGQLMGEVRGGAEQSRRRLHEALQAVRLAERHVPCETHTSLWTSNDPADREAAAHRCQSCPVRVECGEASGAERLGVWGAHIRVAGSRDW